MIAKKVYLLSFSTPSNYSRFVIQKLSGYDHTMTLPYSLYTTTGNFCFHFRSASQKDHTLIDGTIEEKTHQVMITWKKF